MKKATAVHFIKDTTHEVLLAHQQFKVIGLKGYGGKIDEGESPTQSVTREVVEETGGIIFSEEDLVPVALIDFYNGDEQEVAFGDPSFRVLFYNCFKFDGIAIDTEEMKNPAFYQISHLPVNELVPGDELFLQDILEGKMLKGWIRRTKDFKTILGAEISPAKLSDLVI